MVTGKGADPSTAIPIPYVLERKSSGWLVKGPSKSAMADTPARMAARCLPDIPAQAHRPMPLASHAPWTSARGPVSRCGKRR